MRDEEREPTEEDIEKLRVMIEEVSKIPDLVCKSEHFFEVEPLDNFQILPTFVVSGKIIEVEKL